MKVLAVIFSNIHDSSLGELTSHRTVASLPFGGRYRQIDFVLSSLSNSGIYHIGIITKYNYRSLMDHLRSCGDWDLNRKNESVVFLPPFASGNTGIYKGKLKALHAASHFISNPDYDYVILCDTTVLCNVDFRQAISAHLRSGCDVTVLTTDAAVQGKKKHSLIVQANKRGRVTELLIDTYVRPQTQIGMGMFIIGRGKLEEAIEESYVKGYTHWERDYLQRKLNDHTLKIHSYSFDGIVLCNEDVRSYYVNNMALFDEKVRNGLFCQERPIYTKVRDEAPTMYRESAMVNNCLIADGGVMEGLVRNSVIFRDVQVGAGAEVRGCIVMQGTRIGQNAKLEHVILDKNVIITDGATLVGTPEHPVIVKKGERV